MVTDEIVRAAPRCATGRAGAGSPGPQLRYYDQQEELLYRNQQDRKAESEGAIRDYRAKEKEARNLARRADDPMEQLRLKKEARKWGQRAEEDDEDFRETRKKLRDEAESTSS